MFVWCWPLCTTIVALAAAWRWRVLKYRAGFVVGFGVLHVAMFKIGLPFVTRGGYVVSMSWSIAVGFVDLCSYVALVTVLTGIVCEVKRRRKTSANQAVEATS